VIKPAQQFYSIKDLENFTQIKAHTLRIWEKRYQLLNPERTDSNVRLYSESDLKKLLNIKLLYSNGFKISKIASLIEQEIKKEAKCIIENSGNQTLNKWTNSVIIMILDFDVHKIDTFLKQELVKANLASVYLNKVIPLMKKLGELWQVDSIRIVHEHFFSNIYREFIISQISQLPDPPPNAPKVVLFLHSQEEHEFSILMYYYLLKKKGLTCYYFGQKTPIEEVEALQQSIHPSIVITTFTSKISEKSFKIILASLIKISEDAKVIISGNQVVKMNLSIPNSINFIETAEELDSLAEFA
jgi:DNA-binding transcriptional MerR regulator